MPDFLRFGIPSLDKLIGSHGEGNYGVKLTPNYPDEEVEGATGICIMGPDGTGKSVFALHLASQYLADCLEKRARSNQTSLEQPQVYYISTDLNHNKALKIWNNFALNKPFDRNAPFEQVRYSFREQLKGAEVKLAKYLPPEVVEYIRSQGQRQNGESQQSEVCFIDLASTTAGDDWGFVHRLLALMQPPKGHPHHLVIIDAVEGLETYVGQLDAFGETSSRRARVAQLARLAVNKTHVLLVVEEMRTMQRLPEEFVTDIVIRLRNVEANRYLRRTIEVEKARGQSLIRGQHPFSIRKGRGSTTGSQVNVDDPEVAAPATTGKASPTGNADRWNGDTGSSKSREAVYKYQDYVQVFPSLNYLNRAIMELPHAPRESPPKEKYAAFGIRYLDNMLGGEGFEAEYKGDYDTRGLPCGTVTALIGDSLTQKTHLGRTFLSRCFYPFTMPASLNSLRELANEFVEHKPGTLAPNDRGERQTFKDVLAKLRTLRQEREDSKDLGAQEKTHKKLVQLKRLIAEQPKSKDLLRTCGVAVLFTTQDTHHEALAEQFLDRGLSLRMGADSDEKLLAEVLIESRTICRRMEIVDVPASTLAHIFEQNIRKAQEILSEKSSPSYSERFKVSKRIRVVFDDFSAFRNTYHEVREEPLFLPYLPFFLGREGVTALIVDTQSISRPDLTLTERYESELRELVQYRLYTWRVPFYGDNRVAITAIPPFSPATSGAIRELRWEGGEDAEGSYDVSRSLDVNPQFELYIGLEEGELRPVPIEIRFYAESQAFVRYLEAEEVGLAELFVPYEHKARADKPTVIFSYGPEDYSAMRDFCGLQRGTRLDHTLVFQVDEFWTLRRPRSGRTGAFRPQWEYLNTPTWDRDSKRDAVADPYAIFQPTKAEEKTTKENFKRLDFYDEENVPYVADYNEPAFKRDLDRVPFSWDFGFLLCKGSAWRDAADLEIFGERAVEERRLMASRWSRKSEDSTVKVGELWESLTKAGPQNRKGFVDWFQFLAACKRVAELQSYKTPSVAQTLPHSFDFAVFSPESFPSLVLEIWASEILKDNPDDEERLSKQLSKRSLVSQPDRKFRVDDLKNPARFAGKLRDARDPLYQSLRARFSSQMQEQLANYNDSTLLPELLQKALVDELNRVLGGPPLLDEPQFAQDVTEKTRRLIWQNPLGEELFRLNWYLLAKADPDEIAKRPRSSLLELLEEDRSNLLSDCLRARYGCDKNHELGFSLELYKTWLLLIEAIDFASLISTPDPFSTELKPRQVSTSVVAARHWYKTACQFIESISQQELEADWVPVRLPGHFSVRGDWFLTVAGGSRSSRLADRALDMLGSKRANISRLDEGIGLPVRKLFANREQDCHLRTRLITYDGRQLTNLFYQDFLNISANPSENFYWLWRSNLHGYHSDLRIWHRWLSQMVVWWHSLRLKYASSWTSCFDIYARLENLRMCEDEDKQKKECEELIKRLMKLESWKKFHEMVNDLIDSLKQVSVASD